MITYYELEVVFLTEDNEVIKIDMERMSSPFEVCQFMNETATDYTSINCYLVTDNENGDVTMKRVFFDFDVWDWQRFGANFLYAEEIEGAGRFGDYEF